MRPLSVRLAAALGAAFLWAGAALAQMPNPSVSGAANVGVAAFEAAIFGNGADGSVTINSGTTTVTREMDYASLTISGTGHLNVSQGHRIRVSGVLDITNAPAGAIFPQIGSAVYNPTAANASGATGGTGGDQFTARADVPGADASATGKSGGTGVGTAGSQGSLQNIALGGRGGASGAGGASGTPNAGGALAGQRNPPTFGSNLSITTIDPNFAFYVTLGSPATMSVGLGGATGGAGGGDGTNAGGGSGASGAGGGPLRIFANTLNRGASTAASAIAALGENAGTSGAGVAGTAGGGGGSGGGGGGLIHLVVGQLIGSTATSALDVSGGNGAAGGNGLSTGNGGDGGQGGNCGSIDIINISAGTYSHPITGDSAGTAGGAHSGVTGGTLGAGCNGKANL